MGTWSYIELADSRIYGRSSPGNEHSVDLVYQVTWTPASGVDTYPGDSGIFTSGIPLVRQRLPVAVYGSDSFLKTYVCRSVESSPVREGTYVFRVTCRFGNEGPRSPGAILRDLGPGVLTSRAIRKCDPAISL